MRVPVYLVCATLVLAAKAEESIPAYFGKQLERQPQQLQQPQNDDQTAAAAFTEDEALGYLLPRLMAKYRSTRNDYNPRYIDPRLLQLAELETNNLLDQVQLVPPEGRIKRTSLQDRPSLSIVNSLDVLRNRLLLEISRKKAMEGVNRNRDLLCKIGKRAVFNPKKCEDEFIV